MTRARIGLFLAALILFGCDHHQPTTPSAEANSAAGVQRPADSAYTGEPPAYPRATLVALPAEPATSSPPAPSAAPSPAESTPPSASSTSDVTSTSPTPAAPASPDSNSPPAAPSPAAPTSAGADMSRLDMTPPTPAPPTIMDDDEAKKQVVVLATSLGRIVIELDDVAAPRTCGNFRKLVSDGFYNHTTFHRVIPHFMIQGGDPNSKSDDRSTYGQGDPGYTLPAEIELKHVAGAVAMARLPDSVNPQRDSNGSQFFICVTTCPSLDNQYTVFGHVVEGMDVAIKIANQERDSRDDPVNRIEMEATLEPKKQALQNTSSTQ
jgi:peptidyl-prolyl cis-trans isomerase B (cyclophilin B)